MTPPDAIWYGKHPVPWYLALLEPVYGRLAQFHQRWQKARAEHAGVPVVIIGNLTVGGSGKTPLIIHLVNQLKNDLRIGVISRGYGSSAGSGPVAVTDDSQSAQVGDEPLLIRQQTGVPVMVGSHRVNAARALVEQASVELILSDDGLQHQRLKRDLEVVVVDFKRGFGNGRLLPAGPLREPITRLKSVDFVLENGNPESMLLRPAAAVALHSGKQQALKDFIGRPVHAVAGIGNPERFFAMLRGLGLTLITHQFPDHHVYQPTDFEAMHSETVLTTSKDAVKLGGLALTDCWVVPVSVELAGAVAQPLLERILSLMARP